MRDGRNPSLGVVRLKRRRGWTSSNEILLILFLASASASRLSARESTVDVITPGCPTVSIALRIVFSIARHCSWHRGFSLAVARPCIKIAAHFPLQIDCILFAPLTLRCSAH
jgi:hypothetical protein